MIHKRLFQRDKMKRGSSILNVTLCVNFRDDSIILGSNFTTKSMNSIKFYCILCFLVDIY